MIAAFGLDRIRRDGGRWEVDAATPVFLAVDREYDLALLRLRCRATHSDFERARVNSRELRTLNEHVLRASIADVVQYQLRLRRRFEICKAQRRRALLQIRNQMQH